MERGEVLIQEVLRDLSNLNVDTEQLARLAEELKKLGFSRPGYRLASPDQYKRVTVDHGDFSAKEKAWLKEQR